MASATETNAWGLEVVTDAPHLGGFVRGGDPGTFEPRLWKWLYETHSVRTVIDVGCGDGAAVSFFESLGARAWGIDGVDVGRADVFVHDFTTGPMRSYPAGYADLVWSAEFVEHVEERYVPHFLDTFKLGTLVLMTHALPDQAGHHHVNCRPRDYWIGAMAAIGYALDRKLLAGAHARAQPGGYFRSTGLAFRRER